MSIKSAANLPFIALAIIKRYYAVIQKNEEAADEVLNLAILTTAGTFFGFFGRAAVMLSRGQFSVPSLLMYGLIGFGAGLATSSPAIYSFFSKMKTRETI